MYNGQDLLMQVRMYEIRRRGPDRFPKVHVETSKPGGPYYLQPLVMFGLQRIVCSQLPPFFSGCAVLRYRTTLEHSMEHYFLLVHCKKQIKLQAWISAVRSKKQHISITYATNFRVMRSLTTLYFPS